MKHATLLSSSQFQDIILKYGDFQNNLKTLLIYSERIIVPEPTNFLYTMLHGASGLHKIPLKGLEESFVSIQEISDRIRDGQIIDINFLDIDPIKLIGEELYYKIFTEGLLDDYGVRLPTDGRVFEKAEDIHAAGNLVGNLRSLARQQYHIALIPEDIEYTITGFNSSQNRIISQLNKHKFIQANAIDTNQYAKEFTLNIPAVNHLSIEEIFELRKDPRIRVFRQWLRDNKKTIDDDGLQTAVVEGLWGAFKDFGPKPKMTGLKGIVSNLPLFGLPINPLGIGIAFNDSVRASIMQKKYTWLTFVKELNKS